MKKITSLLFVSLLSLTLLAGCATEQPDDTRTPRDTTPPRTDQRDTDQRQTDTTKTPDKQDTTTRTDVTASRNPEQGCRWENFDASSIGINLLVQRCEGRDRDHSFRVEDDAIVEYIDGQRNNYKTIEVFKKAANETPETAIKNQFITKLSAEEQKNCVVEKIDSPKKTDQSAYQIAPTDAYRDQLTKEKEGPIQACGDYGVTNGAQYFLFDEDNPEMFAFVRIGQDVPMFDEKNIEFVK